MSLFLKSTSFNLDEPKILKELYESSKLGKVNDVSLLLRTSDFSYSAIDNAIRHSINSQNGERSKYYETIDELLKVCDINFKNQDENCSTLLMLCCSLGDFHLIEILLNKDFTKSIERKSDYLKMSEKDNNGRNILHYLLTLDHNHMTIHMQRSELNSELNILNILIYLTNNLEDPNNLNKK